MLFAYLGMELFLHIFEGGWFEIVATALAFALCGYVFVRGRPSAELVRDRWRAARLASPRLSLLGFLLRPRVSGVRAGTLIAALARLHVTVVPPWYWPPRLGDFFHYGCHIAALVCALAVLLNRRLPAISGESAPPRRDRRE